MRLKACSQSQSQQMLIVAAILVGVLQYAAVTSRPYAAAALTVSCSDRPVLGQARYVGPAVPIQGGKNQADSVQTVADMPRFPNDLRTSSRALVVTVNVTHAFVGDVRLVLVAPNNQSFVLKAGYANTFPPFTDGGGGSRMLNTRFYSDSCPEAMTSMTALNSSQAPYSAAYRMFSAPSIEPGALPAFGGRWVMLAVDTFPQASTGTLDSWNVKVVGFIEGTVPVRFCPVLNCNTTQPDACVQANRRWACKACNVPWVPTTDNRHCVCPAGLFPGAGGQCLQCPKDFYCPRMSLPLVNSLRRCPANMVTLQRGAKGLSSCLNIAGFYYEQKSARIVRAVPCPEDTYSPGLDKAIKCRACPTGFKTDPDSVIGTATSAAACLAPPGYFVDGASVMICSKGSYQDKYSNATSCQLCNEEFAEGVTTPDVGSTRAEDCSWAEEGFMLLSDTGRAVITPNGTAVDSTVTVARARPCPQGYFCLGGDPLARVNISLLGGRYVLTGIAPGVPQQCPRGLTTALEGAISIQQCVAPPGQWGDFDNDVQDCPSGTYKDSFGRARSPADGCTPCGTGLWLSERNSLIYFTDMYGRTLHQEMVRGSSISCYLQRGMGTSINITSSTLHAIICPANTFGVAGDAAEEGGYRRYGVDHVVCKACPTNMITGWRQGPDVQAASIQYFVNNSQGLSTAQLLSGRYTEPKALITVPNGTMALEGSGSGYYSVRACTNKPNFGYYAGSGKRCAQGYYAAGGEEGPCLKCPPGLTTAITSSLSLPETAADCNLLAAGYTLNSLSDKTPKLCPVGSFSSGNVLIAAVATQADLDDICHPCPNNSWTLDPGATIDAACTLCAPGYGRSSPNEPCQPCGLGTYGAASRSDGTCKACPEGDRTFGYAWNNAIVDNFTPEVTSPPAAVDLNDCLADFSQVVNGAFYLDLVEGSCNMPTLDVSEAFPALSLLSCVLACRGRPDCAAATFDYYLVEEGQFVATDGSLYQNDQVCKLWIPQTNVDDLDSGVAMKTVSAYSLAANTVEVSDMGSGYYAQWLGRDAAACLNPDCLRPAPVTASIQQCYDACTAVNECAGVVFHGNNSIGIDCSLIMAVVAPGASKRSLVRAVVPFRSSTPQNCSTGFRKVGDGSVCQRCPPGQYWDEPWNAGWSCKACQFPNMVSPDGSKCQREAAHTTKSNRSCPAGSEVEPAHLKTCRPCPSGTYKKADDSAGFATMCEACNYTVSTDKTKCQRNAACSRGFEWALNAPGHCVQCEQEGHYKDWADDQDWPEGNATRCIKCPDIGTGKFQNSLSATREHCLNNCDAGLAYDNTDTGSRTNPSKCKRCPWPLIKVGPAPSQCNGVCDIGNKDEQSRTTPNSNMTACITPAVCGTNQEFDKEFPDDVSKCRPCLEGYQNNDGVWLCSAKLPGNNSGAACIPAPDTEQALNSSNNCQMCLLPQYPSNRSSGVCDRVCGNGGLWDGSSNSTLVADIGLDLGQYKYYNDGLYCQRQCGVDKYWDGAACSLCRSGGVLGGSVRPHGGAVLHTCSECAADKVAYSGYCVVPVACTANSEYDLRNPLDADKCTPCTPGASNPDGIGRCLPAGGH